jgi:hypothetical protein
MLAKKIKGNIGEDKMLILHVPDLSPGEVEVIILKEERKAVEGKDILASLPRHRVGKIATGLSREDIYSDAR